MHQARRVPVTVLAVALAAGLPAAAEELTLTGTWSVKLGDVVHKLELDQAGDQLRGKLWSGNATHAPIEGTIKGTEVSFGVPRDVGHPVAPWFVGKATADRIEGEAKVGPGNVPFVATRQ